MANLAIAVPVRSAPAQARRYVWAVFLTFASLALAVLGGLALSARTAPTEAWSPSARYIHFWSEKQQAIAAGVPGARVLLVGGSGVLYSVRAEALEASLGVPVVNLGLHAGLGLDYLLRGIEQKVRPGDAVVLFLEYGLLVTAPPDWTLADYVIPHDLHFWLASGPGSALALAARLTPAEYARKLVSPWRPPVDGAPFRAMLNDHGDLVANRKAMQQEQHRKTREHYASPFSGTAVDPQQAQRLREFVAYCRTRGITVIAGFPAFLRFPEYDDGAYARFYDEVARLYAGEGVASLGTPREFFVDRGAFFDSNYHLHDEGAAAFTALVAPRLERALVCASPARWDPAVRAKCAPGARTLEAEFARDGTPKGIAALDGFSWAEPWGRWTDGPQATITFARPLPPRFRLDLEVRHVFAEAGTTPIEVLAGSQRARVVVRRDAQASVELANPEAATTLRLLIPDNGSPRSRGVNDDARRLGVGVARVRITPLD
jgi:hypothetical protein